MWRIVLTIASEIDGDALEGERWMTTEGIEEFGGHSAAALIDAGDGILVVAFLMEILAGVRG